MRCPFCEEEESHHLKDEGCFHLARQGDRANVALGHRKRRLGVFTHCKSHAVHVNKVPALCLVLSWVPAHWGASDTISHVNKQLLDRVKCIRIEIRMVSSVGRGQWNHKPSMGQRVSQSRHAACMNTCMNTYSI